MRRPVVGRVVGEGVWVERELRDSRLAQFGGGCEGGIAYICIYVYVYVYMCIYVYTYKYMYVCTYIYMYIYIYMNVYMHT